jgi:hypothetical protein
MAGMNLPGSPNFLMDLSNITSGINKQYEQAGAGYKQAMESGASAAKIGGEFMQDLGESFGSLLDKKFPKTSTKSSS